MSGTRQTESINIMHDLDTEPDVQKLKLVGRESSQQPIHQEQPEEVRIMPSGIVDPPQSPKTITAIGPCQDIRIC